MSFNIQEILDGQGYVPVQPTQEEYAEQKRAEKQMCQQMRALAVDKAFSGIAPLTQYLDAQALLSNMSAGNTLLILSQRPEAVDVRTFDAWKESGRSIRTGEVGLLILEPHAYDAQEGGKIVQRTGYNVRRRFDISQTHGLPLTPKETIPFDPVRRLHALAQASPVRLVEGKEQMPIPARFDAQERVIFIAQGFDAEDTFRAVSVAIAEASFQPGVRHSGTAFAAQCAAYIACRRVGMEDMGGFRLDPSEVGTADRLPALDDATIVAASLTARMNRQIAPRTQDAPAR